MILLIFCCWQVLGSVETFFDQLFNITVQFSMFSFVREAQVGYRHTLNRSSHSWLYPKCIFVNVKILFHVNILLMAFGIWLESSGILGGILIYASLLIIFSQVSLFPLFCLSSSPHSQVLYKKKFHHQIMQWNQDYLNMGRRNWQLNLV